jgi:hypothetical protein
VPKLTWLKWDGKGRRPTTPASIKEQPTEWCDELIVAFSNKSNHNKTESQALFWVVIGSTLLTPLFVTLGWDWFSGTVVPSILSVCATGATAWLQLRKPQQLWAMYRSAQRELEDHRARHMFRLNDYQEVADPDKLLAEKVADIAISVHRQWVPMVPSIDNLHLGEPAKNALSPTVMKKVRGGGL